MKRFVFVVMILPHFVEGADVGKKEDEKRDAVLPMNTKKPVFSGKGKDAEKAPGAGDKESDSKSGKDPFNIFSPRD